MGKKPEGASTETLFVAPLACLTRTDLERAGGKGANLGELVRAGFPVPGGFVVTTAAYDQFVAQNGLHAALARALQGEIPSAAAIQAAFEAAAVPPEVEQDLLAAYRRMGPGPVAVRSSATAEDLPGAAFAGQQDTFLNIVGEAALLEAVRSCWASLWNERAIAYRTRQHVDQAGVKLAVVVQHMAKAEAAGVLFTANPVTGARDEILIDANPGLGEAVVSGLVTPDHFVLRRGGWGWRVSQRQAGKHELMIQAVEGGGTQHITGPAVDELPALPEHALLRLARLGAAIQRHFGGPQDVEWAWAEGQPFILQARPMTALPDPPPHASLPERLLANNFIEMLPVRPYPLDLDTWLPALGSAVEPMFGLLGLDWRLIELFDVEDGVVLRYKARLPRPTWKTLLAPLRLIPRILRYHPLRWRSDALLAEMITRARELEARDVRTLAWDALLAMLDEAKEIALLAAGEVRTRYFPRAAFSAVRLRLLLMLLGRSGQFGTLLSGAENKTLEMNRALEGLAAKVRADSDLARVVAVQPAETLWAALEGFSAGRTFLADLRGFLDAYGHRETVISTALEPSWKDSPAVALGIIKGFAAYPPQSPAGPPAWQTARDEILRRGLLLFAPLRSAFLETLEEARTLLQMREDTHFYATLALPVFRRTLLELGRRLAASGALDYAEDVFHLRLAELEQAGEQVPLPAELAAELRAVAARRKAKRARLNNTPLFDPRLFSTGDANSPQDGDALLRGTAGSPGTAQGPVCIVMSSAAFDKLAPGDVLVAPYTNPAWTPLFQRAAAVVVDTGSLASHAAIVAREYGIPAVMATITGTRTLEDGDWVQVDGSRGTVRRAAPPAPAGKEGKA